MKIWISGCVVAMAALASPTCAQDRTGADRYTMVVKAAAQPNTVQGARRTLGRIERAALAVCGASPFSLRELRLAVRDSACWRGSVADAVARIGDPTLNAAYRAHH